MYFKLSRSELIPKKKNNPVCVATHTQTSIINSVLNLLCNNFAVNLVVFSLSGLRHAVNVFANHVKLDIYFIANFYCSNVCVGIGIRNDSNRE